MKSRMERKLSVQATSRIIHVPAHRFSDRLLKAFPRCLHLFPRLLSNMPVPKTVLFPLLVSPRGGAWPWENLAVLCQSRQCLFSLMAGEAPLPASTTITPGPGVCA